ncbi:MAG: carbohydrate-binding domain-containing protein [Oscillospiraceae bacterium]|nr:carbohydrate-binding domain-containing protein [Oscillospiraceae bacterium]
MKQKNAKRYGAAAVTVAAMSLALSTAVIAAVKGDVNGDGVLDVADAVAFTKYLTTEGTITDYESADYNGDGILNAADLTLIKRAVMTKPTEPENPVSDAVVTSITFGASSVTLKNAAGETVDAAKAENVTVENGTRVTITKPGDFDADGECADGQLRVDVNEEAYPEGQVTVNLRGLTLSNKTDSPVYVNSVSDEFVLTIKKDTVNTISDGSDYTNADKSTGAIYSLDDMKIKGKGTLIVNGNCGDGIVCKDDLKIWNGDIQVTAKDDGIRGKDSVRIGEPDTEDGYDALKVTVKTSAGDGIKSTNDTADSGKGFVRISGGTVKIESYADGIQAEQFFEMNGGDVTISTYQGSAYTGSGGAWGGGGRGGMGMDGNPNKTDISAKGIKAVGLYDANGTTWQSMGNLTISGGKLTVDSSDDALHCGGDMTLTGGTIVLATADDGAHSDHTLTIGQGAADCYDDVTVIVTKGYEGIEAKDIIQNSGTVIASVTDDGYNAGGGKDSSGMTGGGPGGGWGQGGFGGGFGREDASVTIKGGLALVNVTSGDHDGIDSNGDLTVTGGIVITNGNEPFDCNGTLSVKSGVWIENSTCRSYMDTQPSYSVNGGSANTGERITLVGSDGKVIVSFIAGKSVSTLRAGGSVTGASFYTGGTLSDDTTYFQTVYDKQLAAYGGTLTGGTSSTGSGSSGGQTGPGGPGMGW